MIIIKSLNEIKIMQEAAKVTANVLEELKFFIKEGITTSEVDRFVENYIVKNNMIPGFKGYMGFPATICISINEEVVHGIPSDRVLSEGDIVSVDLGTLHKGFYSDAARTFGVGKISDERKKLIEVTEQCFFEGIKFFKKGYRLSDISHGIQSYVEDNGFSVVKDFVGHGIGRNMHEDPQIPNYGRPGRGVRLSDGMVFAIEPMVNIGTDEVVVLDDGWTAVTADNKPSAHYENTVALIDNEPVIFTLL